MSSDEPTEMVGHLVRTGRMIRFKDVSMGQPFFAYGAYWTRCAYEAGTELAGHDWVGAAACSFGIDAETEMVEAVDIRLAPGQGFHRRF